MKFFLFIFLVLLVFVTIGMLVVFFYVRKGINYFRRFSTGETSGEEFERMANKYYRKQERAADGFSDDYFKGAEQQDKRQASQGGGTSQGPGTQRQRRTTSGGVTIEDRRDPDRAGKKIFAHDEGEYVDFTEN